MEFSLNPEADTPWHTNLLTTAPAKHPKKSGGFRMTADGEGLFQYASGLDSSALFYVLPASGSQMTLLAYQSGTLPQSKHLLHSFFWISSHKQDGVLETQI
jgi:hypothetical protein